VTDRAVMTPTLRTIIVADSSSPLKGLLAGSSAALVGEFKRVVQAIQEGPSRRPDLVIVDLPEDREGGPDGPPAKMVEALARAFPEAAVFATGPSVSADFVIEVFRAGAVEFLRRPVQPGDLAAGLEKLLRLRRPSQPVARPGRITSVFSTKGGLGVTTVATNLAVCLAERAPGWTILIDLDTRQSDVATFLNLRPTYSVVDALENPDRLDASFLQGLVVRHASGLVVLPGPSRIERGQLVAEQVQVVLEIIRSHFDHVVLDLRHDLDPGTIAALEASDTIFFLTGLTVSALRSGAAGLAAFRHLGLNLQRVKAVVMREGTGEDVTIKHAHEALGLPIHWRTPSDYPTVVSAINSGEPVVTASPRSKIARNLRELAGSLFPRPGAAARPVAGRSAALTRLIWTTKGIPGDG
jgi:pilus assembly protein CpaE